VRPPEADKPLEHLYASGVFNWGNQLNLQYQGFQASQLPSFQAFRRFGNSMNSINTKYFLLECWDAMKQESAKAQKLDG